MYLPSKAKLIVAIGFLLPFFDLAILAKAHADEWPSTKIDVKGIKTIEILRNGEENGVSLFNTLSGRWMYGFDGTKMAANQHAVGELLSMLEALKFFPAERAKFDGANFSWMVTMANRAGNTLRLKISKTHTYYGDENATYFTENGEIEGHLAKIYPELYCKNLLDEVNLEMVSRIKFSLNSITLDFTKLGNRFVMTSPICRPFKGSLLEDILRDIASLQCSSISREHADSRSPLFTFEFKHGKVSRLIEFYRNDSGGIYAKKSNAMCKFNSHTANTIGAVHSKLETFQIFSGIRCSAIDTSNFLENRYFLFRKLENSKQWQKSYRFDGETVLVDIEGDEIRQLENAISGFKRPISFNSVGRMCIAKLSLQSNIGELTFDIFRDLDGYIFLNYESSLAFSVGGELARVLRLLIEHQPQ
ncbi:MAG: hypothetical protein LBD33_03675 [Puniceicoccales bacterium]|jgi:hypothetical protein|nr:hypothetical protein [Puniceicoccales bacterium]